MVVPESFQLDQEILLDAGAQLHRLKMYPYFDIAHYLLMIIEVRDDIGNPASLFSRKHPLSCWLSCMLMCFADAFLANFLLGEPVIAPFKRHDDVILATIVWYLVFYAPFDGIYKISKITPVKCVLAVMKEVKKAYKVSHGVSHAAKLYPNSYLVQVLVGTAKGAGSGVLRLLEQLIRGIWMPNHNEFLRPAFATKACVIAASVLALEKSGTYLTAPHDLIYLVIVGFFVYFKLSYIILHVTDPFAPIENLFCAIFMGGIWDAVSRALAAARDRRAGHSNENGSSISQSEKKDQ